ncbi:hypothetical protein ACFQVA_02930 [Actinomadura keratinilytica]
MAAEDIGTDKFGTPRLFLDPRVADDRQQGHESGTGDDVQAVLAREEALDGERVEPESWAAEHRTLPRAGKLGEAGEVFLGLQQRAQCRGEVGHQQRQTQHPGRETDTVPSEHEAQQDTRSGERSATNSGHAGEAGFGESGHRATPPFSVTIAPGGTSPCAVASP